MGSAAVPKAMFAKVNRIVSEEKAKNSPIFIGITKKIGITKLSTTR
jgi:hypothetical protein